jgi:nucleotide-binding universal stress UspA family protein
MFKTILLPTDLHDLDTRAVGLTRELAEQNHSTVILIHAIQTIQDTPFEELTGFYERLEKQALEKLRELSATLAGLNCREVIVYGDRTVEIVRFAKENSVDLIVMQSHQLVKDSSWASLSHKVGVLAPCSVLLVR